MRITRIIEARTRVANQSSAACLWRLNTAPLLFASAQFHPVGGVGVSFRADRVRGGADQNGASEPRWVLAFSPNLIRLWGCCCCGGRGEARCRSPPWRSGAWAGPCAQSSASRRRRFRPLQAPLHARCALPSAPP